MRGYQKTKLRYEVRQIRKDCNVQRGKVYDAGQATSEALEVTVSPEREIFGDEPAQLGEASIPVLKYESDVQRRFNSIHSYN